MVKHFFAIMGLIVAMLLASALGQANAATRADNTTQNKKFRGSQVTADNQTMDKADVNITQQIRHTLVQSDGLSVYAKNVKIITTRGKVTLEGPVRTAAEKKAVEEMAARVAGSDNVINQLDVVSR